MNYTFFSDATREESCYSKYDPRDIEYSLSCSC